MLTTTALAALAALAAGPPVAGPPGRTDLGSLFPEVRVLARTTEYPGSFLSGRFRSLDDFKRAGRRTVLDLGHYRPERVEPRPELLRRVDCGDHVREELLFSTSPGNRVSAFVLLPKGLKGRAPAIVDLHSHGGMFLFGKEKVVDLGKENHPAMVDYHKRNYDGRPTATALVRRGYVVITIDALFFGERRLMLDADRRYGRDRSMYDAAAVKHLNQRCREREQTLAKGLTFAGATWPGIVFWDDLRTVDYLLTRKEVDPERIGCLGISMGGYRALFLAGLDERVKAACVTGFMSTVSPMIRSHLDTHSHVHFLPGLHRHLDWPDVASLHAPKPLLVQQCSRDGLFPLAGMRASVEKIAAVYRKAGAAEAFSGRFYDEPHRWTRAMQDEAFAWLDRQLKR